MVIRSKQGWPQILYGGLLYEEDKLEATLEQCRSLLHCNGRVSWARALAYFSPFKKASSWDK